MAMQGQCMCGTVKVTISDTPNESVYCHCDNCKRQSGASGTWVAIVDKDKFNLEGTHIKKYLDRKTDSGTPLERYFCGECGCPVYSKSPHMSDKVVVKMGLFNKVPKVTSEWYCKNKQSWEPSVEGAQIAETTPQ